MACVDGEMTEVFVNAADIVLSYSKLFRIGPGSSVGMVSRLRMRQHRCRILILGWGRRFVLYSIFFRAAVGPTQRHIHS
jgi:hypothetical protein